MRQTVPTGWSFNPSARHFRSASALFALMGFLIALYLTAAELHWVTTPWDPIFHQGTKDVLFSPISRGFPVPDALLGALVYLLELVLLLLGDEDRWMSQPGVVLLGTLNGLGLAGASLVLLILQPAVIHAGCLLCLCSTAVSFILLQRSLSEAVAAFQHLTGRRAEGRSTIEVDGSSWLDGISGNWSLLLPLFSGVFLLISPKLFEIDGVARLTLASAGGLTVFSSIVAMAEIARPVQFTLLVSGAIPILWFLGESHHFERWLISVCGAMIEISGCFTSFPARKVVPMGR